MDELVNKFEQAKVQPEQILTPEKPSQAKEQVVEQSQANTEALAAEILQSAQTMSAAKPMAASDQIILAKVEAVLATGLDSIFLDMDPIKQQEFKAKGEETAKKITALLNSAKATVAKLIDLIIDWLKIIPKVNRHFLEQEAKIKADEIWSMYQHK